MTDGKTTLVGLDHGFCRICGMEKDLTEDHVPPQKGGNSAEVIVSYGSKTLRSQNGMRFKTICASCNSQVLGLENDAEYVRVSKDAAAHLSRLNLLPYRRLRLNVSPKKVICSVLGHFMAALIPDYNLSWLKKPLDYSPYQEAIRQFVLGNGSLQDKVKCYYWFYNHPITRISQYFANAPNMIRYPGHVVYGSTYKSFPFAFWIVDLTTSTIIPDGIPYLAEQEHGDMEFDTKKQYHFSFPETPTATGVTISSGKSIVEAKKATRKQKKHI